MKVKTVVSTQTDGDNETEDKLIQRFKNDTAQHLSAILANYLCEENEFSFKSTFVRTNILEEVEVDNVIYPIINNEGKSVIKMEVTILW